MIRTLSASFMALVVVGLLVANAATAAAPLPLTSTVLFGLEGTNGFEITAFATPDGKGEEGQLFLRVAKRGEEATYAVKGAMSGNRIDFDLGGLGKVEAEIRPRAGKDRFRPGCGDEKSVKVPTVELVGTVEFHGEEGFTEASAGVLVADAPPVRDTLCGVSSSEISGEGLPGTELTVNGPAGLHLLIIQSRPGARIEYEARLQERLDDGVGATREVYGAAPSGALRFDKKLSKATFEPGGQLVGSAKYTARSLPYGGRPGHGRFSGDLLADFPGDAEVPLAGSGFSASIDHFSRTSSNEG